MSLMTFIAADIPLKAKENPHMSFLSINEALAIGVDIDFTMLPDDIDRDEPKAILLCDFDVVYEEGKPPFDGDADDNFALWQTDEAERYTTKKYGVYIEWVYYTDGRGASVIEYIKEILQHTDSIELWTIWQNDDDDYTVKSGTVSIDEIMPSDIEEVCEFDVFGDMEQSGKFIFRRLTVTM